jgi:hypothetical protein
MKPGKQKAGPGQDLLGPTSLAAPPSCVPLRVAIAGPHGCHRKLGTSTMTEVDTATATESFPLLPPTPCCFIIFIYFALFYLLDSTGILTQGLTLARVSGIICPGWL